MLLRSGKRRRIHTYTRLRRQGRELNSKLVKTVPRFILLRAGKALGILKGKHRLVFETEDETAHLMDRCIFDEGWEGRTVLDRFITSERFSELTPDEQEQLRAKTKAHYSLFEVVRVDRAEAMLELEDLTGEGTYSITDINMSATIPAGVLLATRLYQVGELWMSTGATCPFHAHQRETLLSGLERKQRIWRRKKKDQRSEYSAYFFKKYRRIGSIAISTME